MLYLAKKLLSIGFLAALVIGLFPVGVNAVVNVKGYYRSNGTYVAPHVRSDPNGLKYDNYSYTPSQGLYNDTYGTRDASWDTPTYVTDPDYYIGKSLYESNSYPYVPTPTYTPAPQNYTCPVNSSISPTDSTKCNCNTGYALDFTKTSCVSVALQTQSCSNTNGANIAWDGTYTNNGRINCACVSGYLWDSVRSSCVLPTPSVVTTESSKQNLINSLIAQIAALQALLNQMKGSGN